MGRPRKCDLHHELSGAMRKDPQRYRVASVPEVRAVPLRGHPWEWVDRPGNDAPKVRRLRAIWDELLTDSKLDLQESDRAGLEGICLLVWKVRWGRHSDEDISEACRGLIALGLDPNRARRQPLLKGK